MHQALCSTHTHTTFTLYARVGRPGGMPSSLTAELCVCVCACVDQIVHPAQAHRRLGGRKRARARARDVLDHIVVRRQCEGEVLSEWLCDFHKLSIVHRAMPRISVSFIWVLVYTHRSSVRACARSQSLSKNPCARMAFVARFDIRYYIYYVCICMPSAHRGTLTSLASRQARAHTNT